METILQTILNIVIIALIISLLVSVHEAGHLAMAKLFKVYCFDYSIGFGPAFLHKRRKGGETYFSLRAIPFGGYVSMYGETDVVPPGFDTPDASRSLNAVAKWKKCIILVAGVTLNFVLGMALIFVSDLAFPQYYYAYGGSNPSALRLSYIEPTYSSYAKTYLESVLPEGATLKEYVVSLPMVEEDLYEVGAPFQIVLGDGSLYQEGAYFVATISPTSASSGGDLTKRMVVYPASYDVSWSQYASKVEALPDLTKEPVVFDSSLNGASFTLIPSITRNIADGGYLNCYQALTFDPSFDVEVTGGTLSEIGIGLNSLHFADNASTPFAYQPSNFSVFLRPNYSGKVATYLDASLPAGKAKEDYALSLISLSNTVSILDDDVVLYREDGTPYSSAHYVAIYYSGATAKDHDLASSIRLYPQSDSRIFRSESNLLKHYPDLSDTESYMHFDSNLEGVYFELNLRFLEIPAEREKDTFVSYYRDQAFVSSSEGIILTVKNGNLKDPGFLFPTISQYRGWTGAWEAWAEDVPYCCGAIVKGLAALFTPSGISNVSGIVGMTAALPSIEAAGGVGQVFFFAGLLSINLAFFNLLPFPGLDGYQIVVTAIEGITKKKIPQKVASIVSFVGLALLFLLMIFITIKDIIGLF